MLRMEQKNSAKGLVSLIQHFSLHDGEGIRTTVFLKGCPLSCRWCQNPETWKPIPEVSTKDEACTLCGTCVSACPEKAITIDIHNKKRIIHWQKCNQCLECIGVCTNDALQKVGRYWSAQEVMAEIERDHVFMHRSEGGITVSGGEPLAQPDFVKNLFMLCKKKGIHTALDTSGFGKWTQFNSILEHTDLVLFDIKHTDPILHKEATGVSNELILENLYKIPTEKRIWLRIPLVQGYNDTKENLNHIVEIVKKIIIEKISILPLHRGGEKKYQQLGKRFQISEKEFPNEKVVAATREFFESRGIHADIGS